MFQFFKKNNDNVEQKTDIASLSYSINSENELVLDINIEDYNDQSIEALCKLLNFIGNSASVVQTLEIIKNFFERDNQQENLIKIITSIASQPSLFASSHISEDRPCIKPSDVLS